ncbi:MAG: ABC transporter permease [Candidatus Thorarchaeota archaeon]|jgi:lipoprotein-releasing system permease protein
MFLFSRLTSRAPQVLATFLIFSLSAGVLGGVLFYMDTSTPNVLESVITDVPVDMEIGFSWTYYNQNTTQLSDIEEIIDNQEIVEDYESIKILRTYDYQEEYDDWRYAEKTFMGVNDEFFAEFPNAVTLSNDPPLLTDTTCYVEESTMTYENLQIGDMYTARVENRSDGYYDEWVERNFTIVGTFQSNVFLQHSYYGPGYYEETEYSILRMITTQQGLNESFGFLEQGYWEGIEDRIWLRLDITSLLGQDPIIAVEELENIRRRIEQEALPYALVEDFEINNAIYEFAAWTSSMRGIALAFSIPSIIMGVMLVYYNSNLLRDDQRRDVGTLKTRGSSGWQAFRWVLSNAIFTGLIGSAGAVLTGALAAFLSGSVKAFFVFDLTQLAELSMLLQPIAVLSVFLFSFSVGLIVALPGAVSALLMSATEAHSILERDVLQKKEKMGSPFVDLIALGIAGYMMLPIISFLGFGYLSPMALGSFMILLIPFMTIFIIGYMRLLSRPVSAIKVRTLGYMKSPSISVGTRIMSRTVGMFKRSEAMGVMFIAMVFTAGVFSTISATTGYNHTVNLFKFQTGADFAIDVKSGYNNVTLDLLENITAVNGVASASAMLSFDAYVRYRQDYWGYSEYINTSMNIYAVQPEEWLQSAFWLPYFTLYDTPANSISQLALNNRSVLSSFRPVDHYIVSGYTQTPVYGDQLTIYIKGDGWRNVSSNTIVDVMAASEEYGNKYLPGEPNSNAFVVMNLKYVHACKNTTMVNKFYIKTTPYANLTEVKRDLWTIAPFSFDAVSTPYDDIDASLKSQSSRSIYGIYTLNVVFSLFYLTAGMIIVTTVRVRRLRKQFSVLRALGTENRSITTALLIDTSISILIAAAIGGLLGAAMSLIAINMPLAYLGAMTRTLWSRLPVTISLPVDLLGGILGISVVSALIAAYWVTSRALKQNIAEEIQYAG